MATPISLAHRITGRVRPSDVANVPRGPHRTVDGVVHLVPRTLMPAPLGSFRVARYLEKNGIRGRFDAILIDQPLLWDTSIRGLTDTLIYRPTDLYPSGLKHRIQQQIIDASDGIIATSEEVLRGLGPLGQPTLVLNNGADTAHFASTNEDEGPRPIRCVYVGALDGRFDWAQLSAWAGSHPDVRFLVAGPDADPPSSLPSNVDLLGPIAYDAVPALLHDARVGLLPLSDDPLNAGRSPMKLYEYLAAGLTVVARETPGIKRHEGVGIYTYSGGDDADAALDRALAHASPNDGGVRAASDSSWERKTDELVSFVQRLS
ncbi:glycosyltransferase family protein [Microbacterium sp. A94]|uniref:glycosyltransferase family protein n=1 Tax=Microbacterium sp. A94 TaxID=3450717 RepID=UPI003F440634